MSSIVISPPVGRIVQAMDLTLGPSGAAAPSGASSSLLPPPVTVAADGDPMTELAILLSQSDSVEKKMDRQAENSALTAEASEDAQEVQAMHDKAGDVRASGWAEGIADVAQGAFEIGSGVTNAQAGKLDWNDVFTSGIEVAKGFGSIVGKQFEADGIDRDADAKAYDAAAKSDDRVYQMAEDDRKDTQAALEKVMDFLKGVKDAESSSLNAAAGMRA